jgi:hypothetical protein
VLRRFYVSSDRNSGTRKINLKETPPDQVAAATLEAEVARRLGAVPVRYEGDRLVVAVSDPGDTDALDEIAALVGVPVEAAQATEASIRKVLREVYGSVEDGRGGSRAQSRIGLDADQGSALDLHEALEIVLESGGLSPLRLSTSAGQHVPEHCQPEASFNAEGCVLRPSAKGRLARSDWAG